MYRKMVVGLDRMNFVKHYGDLHNIYCWVLNIRLKPLRKHTASPLRALVSKQDDSNCCLCWELHDTRRKPLLPQAVHILTTVLQTGNTTFKLASYNDIIM